MTEVKGSCRCGQLTYVLKKAPVLAGYCHCDACKRRTGGPYAGFMMVQGDSCEVSGEYETYSELGGSGQPMIEHRCSTCGSVVFTELKVLKNILAVNAASLSSPQQFQPQLHVWVSRKPPHITINDGLPQESGPPRAMAHFLAAPL